MRWCPLRGSCVTYISDRDSVGSWHSTRLHPQDDLEQPKEIMDPFNKQQRGRIGGPLLPADGAIAITAGSAYRCPLPLPACHRFGVTV